VWILRNVFCVFEISIRWGLGGFLADSPGAHNAATIAARVSASSTAVYRSVVAIEACRPAFARRAGCGRADYRGRAACGQSALIESAVNASAWAGV
jgi:hypothetical protein